MLSLFIDILCSLKTWYGLTKGLRFHGTLFSYNFHTEFFLLCYFSFWDQILAKPETTLIQYMIYFHFIHKWNSSTVFSSTEFSIGTPRKDPHSLSMQQSRLHKCTSISKYVLWWERKHSSSFLSQPSFFSNSAFILGNKAFCISLFWAKKGMNVLRA